MCDGRLLKSSNPQILEQTTTLADTGRVIAVDGDIKDFRLMAMRSMTDTPYA